MLYSFFHSHFGIGGCVSTLVRKSLVPLWNKSWILSKWIGTFALKKSEVYNL